MRLLGQNASTYRQKPLLDEQAAEHAHAVDRANSLAAELATTISSRDAFEFRVSSLTAEASHHVQEVSSLQSACDDLARQVQSLLRQLAIRDDPSLSNIPLDMTFTAQDDFITDHLLEFRSLRNLQEQNVKLLKLTRGLMAKLDQREIARATDNAEDIDTGASLDAASETISKMHAQLMQLQRKLAETTRERDLFSKLLSRGEGLSWKGGLMEAEDGPHEQTIATLRAEIDVVRVKAENDVTEVRTAARRRGEEASLAEVERAKAEAKANLLEGKSSPHQ